MAENQVSLRVLVPDGTTNYIKNPSFRYDTDGWIAEGASLTRTLERARFGVSGGKVVTNGAALHEGIFYRVEALDGISDSVTVSVYVRGNGKIRIRLDDNAIGGGEYISQAVQLTDTRWTRLVVSGRSHGGDDIRLVVETDEESAVTRTFYVDGAQMERKPYETSYCDGDQEKCRWDGILHASVSMRPDSTRAGGRWLELSGPNREAEDLYMTTAGGLGVAPLSNITQLYALAPGSYHQGIKVNSRPITFTFHAKHQALFRYSSVNLEKLHALRQLLIDAVKPDRTAGDEDIWFEYLDGDIPLYFRARYDGGLEGEWDVRNGFVNSFPLRLLAVNPTLLEDSQEAQSLDFQDVIFPNYVYGRIDGVWNTMNYGVDGIGYRFSNTRRQRLYMTGNFTTVNNDANAIDPLLASPKITYWDGEQWQVGADGVDPAVGFFIQALAVAPNGYIYIGRNISGGLDARNSQYWDGSAWNNMGAGTDDVVYRIVAANDGNVYYAGVFTQVDTLNCYRVARWDGSQWHRLGQFGGLNDTVTHMIVSRDSKTIVVAGTFTDQFGFAANALYNIAQYDVDTGQFSAMGGNATDLIRGPLLYTDSNIVYAIGFPETLNGVTVLNLARWTGSAWENLGGAFNANPNGMFETPQGEIIIVGLFDQIGNIPCTGVSKFNGSSVVPMDIHFLDTANPQEVRISKDGDIFIGDTLVNGDQALISHVNIVSNPGTANVKPIFNVAGPGRLAWIENQTTGQTLYLDLYVFENEEVMIDIPHNRMGSELRPNLLSNLLPGSDFGSFVLAPGENKIACLMYDDVGAQMSIQFAVQHWSADAGGSL